MRYIALIVRRYTLPLYTEEISRRVFVERMIDRESLQRSKLAGERLRVQGASTTRVKFVRKKKNRQKKVMEG